MPSGREQDGKLYCRPLIRNGSRLRPLAPILIAAMERHGHFQLAPEMRAGLLAMSAASIDRALREAQRGMWPHADK